MLIFTQGMANLIIAVLPAKEMAHWEMDHQGRRSQFQAERCQEPLVASLLLVAMPFVRSSVLAPTG